MVRLQSRSLGNVEYLFITISARSTLTHSSSSSICYVTIYGLNETVRFFFTMDYYYEWFETLQLSTSFSY